MTTEQRPARTWPRPRPFSVPSDSDKQRRRGMEELILRLKLAPAAERPALLEQLAAMDGLTPGDKRIILLAAQRYLFGRRATVAEPARLLAALLSLTTRETWQLSLSLLRQALEHASDERAIDSFRGPLTQLLSFELEGREADLSADSFLRVIRKYDQADQLETVVEVATIGLFFFPFNGPLREARADCSLALGDAGRARVDYERLMEQYPDRHDYRLDVAEASLKLDDFELALEDLNVFLAKEPDNVHALRRQGECLYQLGRSMEALKTYSRLLELEPEAVDVLVSRARVHDSLELYEEAQKDAERALQLAPADLDARQIRQSLQFRRQSYGLEDDMFGAMAGPDEASFVEDMKVPDIRFSDIGGLDRAKQAIKETIEYPLKFPEISLRYGKKAGGGLLLFGPPGCGKTLLARAAAGECGVKFINVNLASVLDKWVGNSEKAVARIFAVARKQAPSIVFLDEVDALGGSRSNMQSGWEKKLISQLLTELDGVNTDNEKVMVIGATNAPWDVDFALRRAGRMGQLIFVPPPGPAEREQILRLYLDKRQLVAEGLDLAPIAARTERYSADALRQLVENAASIPWREAIETGVERRISQADLEAAVKATPADLAEWEKLVSRYREFAEQSLTRPGIGFVKAAQARPKPA